MSHLCPSMECALNHQREWIETNYRPWRDVRAEAVEAGLIDEDHVAEIRREIEGQMEMWPEFLEDTHKDCDD